MNCIQAEERIGKETTGALAQHLETCPECRDLAAALAEMKAWHGEAPDPMAGNRVRAGVLARLTEERPHRMAWLWVLAPLCLLLAAALAWRPHGPTARPVIQPVASMAPPAPQPAPSPATLEAPARRAKPAVRRVPKRSMTPAEPLLIKLATNDPDVVIYWIIDPKGD